LKFLLDVHIGTSFARALVERGHDVVRAALDYPKWGDERLLEFAVAEQRIVVTQDSDFTDLVYAFGKPAPPSMLYIRCEPEQLPSMVGRVLETLDSGRFDDHMSVIRPDDTRYRPLPRENKNA
jgi:predicted nuclease of predicted toxin-antitoxin system